MNIGLIIAGTHGDETAAVVALSCALRSLSPQQQRHHVVLAVNPDGCQLGLRANANGVDLNRNFPAQNWQSGDTVYRWNSAANARDVVLSTGEQAGSEPETQALCALIAQLSPSWVVSFHEPLACIEDPRCSVLGTRLAEQFELRWSPVWVMPLLDLSAVGVQTVICRVLLRNCRQFHLIQPANAIWLLSLSY